MWDVAGPNPREEKRDFAFIFGQVFMLRTVEKTKFDTIT